jgi:protein required for attachment to host cells
MKNWVVVFNRIEAKIYMQSSIAKPLTPIKKIENSLGREKNSALTTDRPGLDQMRIGKSTVISHGMTREKNPHEDAASQFAHQIALDLETERKNESFDKLILVAEPHMIGLLKKTLDEHTLQRIENCVLKNYSKKPEHEIVQLFIDTSSSI